MPFSLRDTSCCLAYPAEIAGSKWTLLLIAELLRGPRRFCQLQSTLRGISPRTLSDRLRWLQNEGLITRRAFSEAPPRVEYSLTQKGRDLEPVIAALHQFGARWAPDSGAESRHSAG